MKNKVLVLIFVPSLEVSFVFYIPINKKIGTIKDIVSGNVDYYYIDTYEGGAVFPLIEDLLVDIDIENKKVTVKAKKFTEVVMYED